MRRSLRMGLAAWTLAGLAAGALQPLFGIETLGRHFSTPSNAVSESKASVARQFSGRITEIDKQNKTLTIDEKQLGKEIVHIAADTRVLRGEANAPWEQIKLGEEVRAITRKSGQTNRALSIELAREK